MVKCPQATAVVMQFQAQCVSCNDRRIVFLLFGFVFWGMTRWFMQWSVDTSRARTRRSIEQNHAEWRPGGAQCGPSAVHGL